MADPSGMASFSHLPLFTGMPDIAVSRAIHWSVELDRGLRSSKPGAHCEAILKSGPQMLWWSQEPISSAITASLFKLEPGQDKTFANALVQRLAEAFRTGNNLTRFCVLKVFLLASKGPRLKNRCNTGLFKKERIANYPEVLRRVKAVLDSGDAIARALALRLIGCLAELAFDSVDVHRLIFEALQSPHHKEVEAALYAMGCLCELSVEFAQCALEKLVNMVYTMQTPPNMKLAAIRVFAKLGLSPSLSAKAQKAGKDLLLWLPTTEIVSVTLMSLTSLALESVVTIRPQVEVLMAYLSSDPRATVRAVALQCLSRLALQAARSNAFIGDEFRVILSVIEEVDAPPALHVLTFQLLKKLSAHFVMTVDPGDLQRLLSFLELSAFHHDWSVTQAALDCSVEFACSLTRLTRSRYEGQGEESRKGFQTLVKASESPNETQTGVEFATRVALLLCDQLAFVGARGKENHKEESAKFQEASEERRFERLCLLHEFIVRLVRGCPQISYVMIDSVSGIIERSTSEQLQDSLRLIDKQQSVTEISHMEVDNEARTKSILEGAADQVVDTACRDFQLLESRLEFVLALCRCLCVCVRDLEVNIACIVFPKLLDLSTMIQDLDPSCEILRAILPALLKTRMIYQQRDISAEKSVKRLILRTIVQMRRSGDFWAAYKVGVEAARYGLWAAVYLTFELLAKKAQSEGCYLWLFSLSQLAKAEGILANVTANEESLLDRMRSREADSDLRRVRSGGFGPVGMDLDESFTSTDEHTAEKGEEKVVDCLMFGEAAARAIPLLRGAGNSLAAGVCSERTFEFQRWLISLRLRLIQTVAEFVRVINFLSLDVGASDEEASRYNRREGNHINMQNLVLDIGSAGGFEGVTGDEVYQRQFESSYKSTGEKSFALGTQLMHRAKELDLLSISFMGLDPESSESISRTALSCSLLAFCSHAVFSISPIGREHHSFDIQPSAQDLYNRLRQFKGFECTELSCLCVSEKPDMESFGTASFGSATTSLASICKRTLENVFQLRKEGAAMVQSGQLQAVCGRGMNILHTVVSEWFQSHSPIPKFFFCTRPRTSVELFVAQTGGEEPNELSVNQGSALPLSLCAQVTNLPQRSSLKLKTLSCLLSFQAVENTSLLEEDLYAGWKLGWHEGQASYPSRLNSFSLLGKLVLRAKLEGSPDSVKLEEDLVSMQEDINGKISLQDGEGQGLSTGGAFGRSFVSVAMDGKGYGFASCVLDVSSRPCGIYQLSLHSVGTDTGNRPWVLLTSPVRHTFRITPAS